MVDKKKDSQDFLTAMTMEAGTVTIELEDGTMKTFEKAYCAYCLAFDF